MEMTNYMRFIHLSRYARWIEDEGRRETFEETVDRYLGFFKGRHPESLDDETWAELRKAILNLDVMPSMRALMTAGPALDRDNVAGYNCSYLAIDNKEAFAEAMYILMCGTGVGFSVEKAYVEQLPEVPARLMPSGDKIVVPDSKNGWASAFRELITQLYQGYVPDLDYSEVRPAGERLKTFGGRASGPAPLKKLVDFTIDTFMKAQGRQLKPIECHDIMCMIGDVVVCGGVRRSALISLSDMEDEEMRVAKAGEWWNEAPHRALANNSTIYHNNLGDNEFWNEWKALEASMSGERGIFSRDAADIPERREQRDFGTNPCSEIILRSKQFCNLSEVCIRATDTVADVSRKVALATVLGTLQSGLDNLSFLSKEWEENTKEERLLGVSMTGICDNPFFSTPSEELNQTLASLREIAVGVNEMTAEALGINPSKSITCVKPSGTVSQLCDTASGIHPRYAPYYVRRVRMDNKDSLASWLINAGAPYEKDFYGDSNVVFSFPVKAPESVFRNDRNAIEQLELWLTYQTHWCEHKPSVTIYVADDEWDEVGRWVKDHLDVISGVSFLPKADDSHTYVQAPYEDITEEKYAEMVEAMPDIDFSTYREVEDNTTASQELACKGGACEIV